MASEPSASLHIDSSTTLHPPTNNGSPSDLGFGRQPSEKDNVLIESALADAMEAMVASDSEDYEESEEGDEDEDEDEDED